MAQNYIAKGNHLDFTLTADTASGDLVAAGDLVGVALHSGVSGDVIQASFAGIWDVKRAAADQAAEIAMGTKLYYLAAERALTIDAAAGVNPLAGHAVTDHPAGTTATVLLLR